MPTAVLVQKQYRAIAVKVVLILLLAAIQPFLWGQVAGAARYLKQRQSQDQQVADLKVRLSTARTGLAEQAELRDQLDVIVPRHNSLPQIIDRLERLATQQQVILQVNNIRPKSAEETAASLIPAEQLVVTLQARGRAENVLRYLDVIEHTPELTVVEQVALLPDESIVSPPPAPAGQTGTPPGGPAYILNVQIVFFLQPDADDPQSL